MEILKKFFDEKKSKKYLVNYQELFNYRNKKVENQNDIKRMFVFNKDEEINLYYNFPWCERHCNFCNYTSGVKKNDDLYGESVELIIKNWRNMKSLLSSTKISSVFFGGGTPTALPPNLLEYYLKNILFENNLIDKATITVESNINNLVEEKLAIVGNYANRMSIGIQSFDKTVRQSANMLFDTKDILNRINLARKYIDNINIDLIYGLQNQDKNSFLKDIQLCINEELPSISLYGLELHENLKYCRTIIDKNNKQKYYLECSEMLYEAENMLEAASYIQQPTGWFVRNKSASGNKWEKRVKDWEKNSSYLGFGNGAYSHLHNDYISMYSDFEVWSNFVNNGKYPIAVTRKKENDEKFLNKFIKILRTKQEISESELKKISLETDINFFKIVEELLNTLHIKKLFIKEDEAFKLTKEGLSVINWIILEICYEVMKEEKTKNEY